MFDAPAHHIFLDYPAKSDSPLSKASWFSPCPSFSPCYSMRPHLVIKELIIATVIELLGLRVRVRITIVGTLQNNTLQPPERLGIKFLGPYRHYGQNRLQSSAFEVFQMSRFPD